LRTKRQAEARLKRTNVINPLSRRLFQKGFFVGFFAGIHGK
jgi:hypothetical protein